MLEGASSNNVGGIIEEVPSHGKEVHIIANVVDGGGGRGEVGCGEG